jgi:hypothetical protein
MWNNFDFTKNTPKTDKTPREFYTENQTKYIYEPTFAKRAYTKSDQAAAFDRTLSEYTTATTTPATAPAQTQTQTEAVPASKVPGNNTQYPKEGTSGFDKSKLQVGDIYQTQDGKFKKVTSQPAKFDVDENSDDFKKIFNSNKGIAFQYQELKKAFDDPDVKAEFVQKFKDGLDKNQYFGKNITQAQKDALKKLEPDEIVKQFLDFEKANLALAAHNYDVKGQGETSKDIDTKLRQIGIAPPKRDMGLAQQMSYIAYRDLLQNPSEKVKPKLDKFSIEQRGRFNESLQGQQEGSISQADAILANTTRGQIAGYDFGKYGEEDFIPEQPVDETVTQDETKQDVTTQPPMAGGAPWWAQDEAINLATFGNLYNINKQLPFVAPYEPPQMFASYIDPDRQIAAINEAAGQAVQGLASYSGPQAFSSRMSDLQGNAAKSIADTLSSVNNANQNIYNQANQINVGLQDAGRKAAADRATNIFDKNTIANQQFENSKNQARQQYVQSYTNAITNAAKAQGLNTLYPQYRVDPSTGGMIFPTGVGKPFDGSQTASEYDWDEVAKRKNMLKTKFGIDDKQATQMAKEEYDRQYKTSSQQPGIDPNYFTQYQGLFN